MKIFLRLFFKILGTPFFLVFSVLLILLGRIEMFFYWVYDAEILLASEKKDEAKEIERIKKWFTAI